MTTQLMAYRLDTPLPQKQRRNTSTKERHKAAAAPAKAKKEALSKDLNVAWRKITDIIDELSLKHNMKEKKMKKLVFHLSGPLNARAISDYNVFSHITKLKIQQGAKLKL